ncbi:cytochrome P450 78A6-like [Impatiens glandulifera]|uniref:cytochrome P450 78A6-like n=1 Tax=Impatiens glandulifera TaxID=253017 RepID=UPI001FB12122|nr:cytochrome P450 78A6-like [Impatiens glandulifera]
MITTEVDSLWLFGLFSKSKEFHSFHSQASSFLFLTISLCLSMSFLYWLFPGGPAWGNHYLRMVFFGSYKPIPGPKGLPFIGSMSLMSGLAHHRIRDAAIRFGAERLMAFSLGETRVIVTCNPDVAKDILNGSVFLDRPVKVSAYGLMFNRAIGFAPHGLYWRTLRRISASHLFCPKQIKSYEARRFEIGDRLVTMFKGRGGEEVSVRDVLKRASLSNMMWSVFGFDYRIDMESVEGDELRGLVDEGHELLGTFNWSDHLHWLADLDLQKVRVRCSELVVRVNRFVSRIIEKHRAERGHMNRDFVDVLLSLEGGPDQLSESDMIAVLWEMIFRGTDTVAVLIEWVLARMVLHPDVQSRVQDELDRVVGKSSSVKESHITDMVYLPAVVKEVLRLHPPGPLLSWARLSITETKIDGYVVPAGTTAMVNMWAIMRDPKVWTDPLEFRPERFMGLDGSDVKLSVMGSDLRIAPFGSGRRMCPGKSLGLTVVTFWVATLLYKFKWMVSSGRKANDLDEVLRLSSELANPLTAKLHDRNPQSYVT